MKKLILGLLVATMFSCEKEDEIYPDTNNIQSETAVNNKFSPKGGDKARMRMAYYAEDWLGEKYFQGCWSPAGNCYPVIVVTGMYESGGLSNSSIMQGLISEIKTASQSTIIALFQNNEAFLKQYISDDLVEGTIAGNFIVTAPDATEQPDDSFIQFDNLNNELFKVCSFSL